MSQNVISMWEESRDSVEYSSKNMDHLGIVAKVCKEIDLASEIDRIVGMDPRQKVSCGEAVVAMVLNMLGFVDRPLYLFPEFMGTKPVEILIREELKPEDFNDDVLGRTLDKLYRAGPEGIFMQIAANAYGEYLGRFWHNDTSTISLQGEYEHEEGDIDAVPIEITHGFSKDHRPDLKQFVVSLVMSDSLPVFIQALNGNTSDKDHFREIVQQYGQSLRDKWGEDKIWVWDSAAYSEKNLKAISKDYIWITRVPETLTEAKDVLESADMEKMRSTALNGYHIFTTEVEYEGVKQRWVVVFSEKAFARETKTLEKKIGKEKEKVEKAVWHFNNQEFYSLEDALNAAREMEKGWKYHKISATEVVTKRKRKGEGRGRPRKDEPTQTVYRVKIALAEEKSAVERETLKKGKFIVATNELDSEKLGDEEALKSYKEQQHAERGFRFLKDPLFFAHSLFLKKESRIVAMVMIMGLALMVYAIAERKLREALEKVDETIPDQKGKPTKKPTIRRVFQVFEGITVLYKGSEMVKVLNMKPIHQKVLSLLGHEYERMYCTGYG
ncbi:IS1634 family transposase [Methanophagales archaeon]|nr:MAG: IS1634 family transposase [Methanophagales archaeon]